MLCFSRVRVPPRLLLGPWILSHTAVLAAGTQWVKGSKGGADRLRDLGRQGGPAAHSQPFLATPMGSVKLANGKELTQG